MARDNALWGAERIRGELLKLGIRISKRTIQKHLRRLHAGAIWAVNPQIVSCIPEYPIGYGV